MENKNPIEFYKRGILKILKDIWKKRNTDMWCGVYMFLKYYTGD